MSAEQFEQAKEAFAYKHATPDMSRIEEGFVPSEDNINALLSDLTSLLEQHKEVILREELIAYDKWASRKKWMTGVILSPEKAVDEYLEYLKNVKK